MSIHPSRVLATILLLGGGFVVGVAALAIVVTRILVDAGLPVRPADAAMLNDLIPLLPLIGGFAAASAIAAVGLLLGRAWADSVAVVTAGVAVAIGAVGLLLIALGADPFASTVTSRSTADGFGIVGLYTVAYLAVVALVGGADRPGRVSAGAAA
jgi:hypothetical protein